MECKAREGRGIVMLWMPCPDRMGDMMDSVPRSELLGEIKNYFPLNCSHCLLYQAIEMSPSDGAYHDKEKAAVALAAKILGIEGSVVNSIEALMEMEDATDRLRRAMMKR